MFLGSRLGEGQPVAVEGTWDCVEYAAGDTWQGIVLDLGSWA